MGISNFPPHLILLSLSLIFNVIDSTTAVSIQHESKKALTEERNRPVESAIHWTELMANGELDQRSKRALFLNLINAQQAKAEENIRRRKDFFKVLVAATGSATTIDEREFNDSQSALTP